jgi:hypothetical protein
MRYGMMSVNPVLVRNVLDPLKSGRPEYEGRSDSLWTWVRDNIHLPNDFIDAYEKERGKRKAAARAKAKNG